MTKDKWTNRRRNWAVRWYNFWADYPWVIYPIRFLQATAMLAVLAAIGFVASIAWGAFGKLPTEDSLSSVTQYTASEIYAADSTLLGRYYFENRSNVRYKDISPHFINALVATEDARYFEHHGIDLRAWMRVLLKSIIKGERSSGGGSTLSQQLAKNLYPRSDYGPYSLVVNKIKEVFIAKRLEEIYDKQELLELYLNTVPFSENTYGIKVAAQRFFNTSPARLTPSQSAVLVGMLKATSVYNPVTQPANALERRNLVLAQMAKYGYLSSPQADSLQREPISLNYSPITHHKGPATYFREHLRLELKEKLEGIRKPNGMAYNLYTDGLKIYTTLDYNIQAMAEAAVDAQMAGLQQTFYRHLNGQKPWEAEAALTLAVKQSERYKRLANAGLSSEAIDSIFRIPVDMEVFSWDKKAQKRTLSPLDSIEYYMGLLNAGFLAVDPQTGEVKAWVGGISHQYFQYDHVLSKRQPGSTFKPIVYATAIQRGISPCTYYPNELRSYPKYENWAPKNATDEYGGYYSLEGGLINSINTVTVQLMMQAGPGNVARLAGELGVQSPIPAVPSIALGAVEASLMDMVSAYSTFAARGKRPNIHYLRRVETADGTVLFDYEQLADTCEWQRPMWPDEADIMNEMLQAAVDRGTGRRIRFRYNMKEPLAGKTGTSQNHSDGWFIGYTPGIVAGAWVGAESPAVRFRDLSLGQGANTALPIVAGFIQELTADEDYAALSNTPFPEPSEAVKDALNCSDKFMPKPKDQPDPAPEAESGSKDVVGEQSTFRPRPFSSPSSSISLIF
ncbi:MAG: transglycosylase domain-containing protein [Phaeodactylibacter sp.]|nr:transglycosylase domain-containing protein [Phaeodactylibacter sp.]